MKKKSNIQNKLAKKKGKAKAARKKTVDLKRTTGVQSTVNRDKARIKAHGEIFTPAKLAREVTGRLQKRGHVTFDDPSITVLDPACGNGQMLMGTLEKRLAAGMLRAAAVTNLFGIDIMADNIAECCARLAGGNPAYAPYLAGNFVQGDALKLMDKIKKGRHEVFTPMTGVLKGKEIASTMQGGADYRPNENYMMLSIMEMNTQGKPIIVGKAAIPIEKKGLFSKKAFWTEDKVVKHWEMMSDETKQGIMKMIPGDFEQACKDWVPEEEFAT